MFNSGYVCGVEDESMFKDIFLGLQVLIAPFISSLFNINSLLQTHKYSNEGKGRHSIRRSGTQPWKIGTHALLSLRVLPFIYSLTYISFI